MNPLEQRLNYKFRNALLLAEALTHPSIGHETQRRHFDNQRLEFLGDAILQLIVTEHLFARFPGQSEGQLTKMRSRLVSREGLRRLAVSLGLGAYIMMGKGEEANGGRTRASALADAYEALLGALYLDSGLVTVRDFVVREMEPALEELGHEPIDVNPKGRLQETLQSISLRSPKYTVISQEGPDHLKEFATKVLWEGLELGSGRGNSKKMAEMAAAVDALERGIWKEFPRVTE